MALQELVSDKSIEDLYALKLKFRDTVNGKAVAGQKPLEERILRISNDSKVFLTFTNDMIFPGNFTDILNDRYETANATLAAEARVLADEAVSQGLLSL